MDGIPVVDLSGVYSDSDVSNKHQLNQKSLEIREALSSVGFMQIINHGISGDLVSKTFKLSKEFFGLPLDEKLKYKKSDVSTIENYSGYSQPGEEIFSKSLEHRETFDWTEVRTACLDNAVPKFSSSINELHEQLKILAKTMLRLLAIALELDEDFFINKNQHWVDPEKFTGLTNIRLAHYPGISEDTKVLPGTVRIGEHTDYITITFLFQDDVGGLEAKTADGDWVPVTPINGAIVLNAGDLLEYWSKGLIKATPHRILIPDCKEKRKIPRYSIAFFSGPDTGEIVTPLDILLTEEEKQRLEKAGKIYSSEPVIAIDHVMGKVKRAYSSFEEPTVSA